MTTCREAATWRRLARWYFVRPTENTTLGDAVWGLVRSFPTQQRMMQRLLDHDAAGGFTNNERVLACLFLACEAADEDI